MAAKRSIFEEVGAEKRDRTPRRIGMIDQSTGGARGAVRLWLMALFALVVMMIVVGGLTRLTDSGLAITEWRPVTGALPPLSEAGWQSEFQKYQAIPEYLLQNQGMSLADFKTIYWWEWGHRQLGRFIGLVWAIGYLGFVVLRKIPPGWTGRLAIPGALGALQGAVGWWMVSSGLDGAMLDVASYRLAVHLGLAFIILGVLGWYVFLLGRQERDLMQSRRNRESKLFSMGTGLMHFALLQILLGALVAGIDAGRNYTDWPLMAGGILPPYPLELTPVWRNFFENAGLVQFMHRVAGYGLLVFGVVVWARARRSPNRKTRFAVNAVFAMALLQTALGITTVIYAAPLAIAVVHQFGAVVFWTLVLRARFIAGYPISDSIRGRI